MGPSTGAIVHAIATLQVGGEGLIVGISPDGGQKYASYYRELVRDEE
ncbi:MAG: hypothetical protein HYW06_12660 [Gemmatimonadetes bacterium]|nr:hypothetical protein [Gemmatimonadota bacterium]